MKFEIEIPDGILQNICEKSVENAFNETKYSNDFGNKLKGIIEISVKQTINKNFVKFDGIIQKKVETSIDEIINKIVSDRLENRVKKILSEQLKQKSLL